MNYKGIRHIIFDLDNTLWDFSGNSKKILFQLFAELDLHNGRKINFEHFHEQYKFRNEFLWREYALGHVTREEVRFNRFYTTLVDFGINDYALAAEAADFYVQHTRNQTDLLPHAVETLTYLSGKYPLHIITNGFEEVQLFKLRNSGIEHFFTTVTTAEAANALKPDKRIFDYALHQIKAPAAECVFIGDSADIDGNGARDAGMDFILFDEAGRQNEYEVAKIQSLLELTSIF